MILNWLEKLYDAIPADISSSDRLLDLPAEMITNYHGGTWTLNDNPFSEWYYGSWNKTKYEQYLKLRSIGFISDYMDYLSGIRSSQEYLDRYGMDYTDIHDPSKLPGSSAVVNFYSSVRGSAVNFVSKNISRLYR